MLSLEISRSCAEFHRDIKLFNIKGLVLVDMMTCRADGEFFNLVCGFPTQCAEGSVVLFL